METPQPTPAAAAQAPAWQWSPAPAPTMVASLTAFPPELQQVIADAVLKCKPRVATDIWYHDEDRGSVFVLRSGMQWELNPTATLIWLELEGGPKKMLEQLQRSYPDTDKQELRLSCAEFLLNAHSWGIIDLYPPAVAE